MSRRTAARDAARLRVYEAERAAESRLLREERIGRPDGKAVSPRNPKLVDDEVQPFLNMMTNDLGIPGVEAVLVPNRPRASYTRSPRQIELPPWARCPLVIVHEVAHFLVHPNFPGHGPEFLAAQLDLLERFTPDPVARYFREAYQDEDLPYVPSPKQALRFLSYAKRKGSTEPIYVILEDGRRIEGQLAEYDRREGFVTIADPEFGVRLDLSLLRYASWQ